MLHITNKPFPSYPLNNILDKTVDIEPYLTVPDNLIRSLTVYYRRL